jgi:hypothetical protein
MSAARPRPRKPDVQACFCFSAHFGIDSWFRRGFGFLVRILGCVRAFLLFSAANELLIHVPKKWACLKTQSENKQNARGSVETVDDLMACG